MSVFGILGIVAAVLFAVWTIVFGCENPFKW